MTLDRFSPLVGKSFAVAAAPDAPALSTLILTEAQRSHLTGEGDRPFVLLFEGETDSHLEQQTYWLSTEAAEPEPIFLVPVGPRLYEAVFN